VLATAALIDPLGLFRVGNLLLLFVLLEMVRIVTGAIWKGRSGAWVVGIGLMAFAIGITYDLLLDVDLIEGIAEVTNGYYYGFTVLTIAMAAYLSQNVAKTSEELVNHERRLREEEISRRVLEADVARKTQELEEARTLQLSMLPRTLPVLDTLDIAVHMETATEVGGDYYDFYVAPDGSLTIAVGDATGHGLKAGIMVAIAKSLFKAVTSDDDFAEFFNQCTHILKQMYLGNLFMAMTLVRIDGKRLVASAAGMPPILHYKAQTGVVDEIILKGMPLGAFDNFPYQQIETKLAAGDSILLVTDGLEELFSGTREMLGKERLTALFQSVANRPVEDVATSLKTAAANWRGDQRPGDDITFVVVKVRPTQKRQST
jgi:serine phosphatase RsbU (regulator of sigma subunit)